jgi:hypothetical protein
MVDAKSRPGDEFICRVVPSRAGGVNEYDKISRARRPPPFSGALHFPESLMNRVTSIFIAMLVCAFLAVVGFFLIDLSGEKVFATPQEAFDESCKALKKNDMRGWCQCLTNDSRDFMAANMAVQEFRTKQEFAGAGNDDKKAHVRAVEQVFAKHGLTDEFLAALQPESGVLDSPASMKEKLRFAQEVLKPVSDRCSFVADMFEAVLKESGADNPFLGKKDDKLSDVNINGKIAKGTVTTMQLGRERIGEITFRKQGEGWRIELFAEETPRMPGLPPGHPPVR